MSQHGEFEDCIAQVEQRLAHLGEALRTHDAEAVETEAAALQQAMAAAVERLRTTPRAGGRLPPPLRQRLALAGARVAAQRDSLARASAALDRAIEVLLPSAAPRAGYTAAGLNERPARGGRVLA